MKLPSSSAVLAMVVTIVWGAVWAITQLVVSPPLGTSPTIAISMVLGVIVIYGYGSFLRGRRRWGGTSTSALDAPDGDVITAVRRTLPYLQHGLTADTADQVAQMLLPLAGASGVAIADTHEVIGLAGEPFDDVPDLRARAMRSRATETTSRNGDFLVCAPLSGGPDELAGSLVAMFGSGDHRSLSRVESLAQLLSIHVELSNLTAQAQLAADAKLDALRAQINPHFLFNTLNTIASKSRTAPDEARALLQRLADFFRYALRQDGQFAEFSNEYFFVRTYVALEQARYDDRLRVTYDIDPQVLHAKVPVLTIQPLVENAVKHGLAAQPGGGLLVLKARVDPLSRTVKIEVRDDGVGMSRERLEALAHEAPSADGRSGVGVSNIRERLEHLFGDRYRMDIRSTEGKGTSIQLDLPFVS